MENNLPLTFIKGEKAELWAPTADNVELYAKWINLPSGRIYSRVATPQRIGELKNLLEPKPEELAPTNINLEIYHVKDKKSIGIISLLDIDWLNRKAKVAIIIGESEYWGKEIAVEALKLILNYAFVDLNLHKVYAGIFTPDIRSKRLFEKLGAHHEATLKEEGYIDGKYYDTEIFALYKKEWNHKR